MHIKTVTLFVYDYLLNICPNNYIRHFLLLNKNNHHAAACRKQVMCAKYGLFIITFKTMRAWSCGLSCWPRYITVSHKSSLTHSPE